MAGRARPPVPGLPQAAPKRIAGRQRAETGYGHVWCDEAQAGAVMAWRDRKPTYITMLDGSGGRI
jgi:hypothetical protein